MGKSSKSDNVPRNRSRHIIKGVHDFRKQNVDNKVLHWDQAKGTGMNLQEYKDLLVIDLGVKHPEVSKYIFSLNDWIEPVVNPLDPQFTAPPGSTRAVVDRFNKIFERADRVASEERREMQKLRIKAFNYVLTTLSRMSLQKVQSHPQYYNLADNEHNVNDPKNPHRLWKIIVETHTTKEIRGGNISLIRDDFVNELVASKRENQSAFEYMETLKCMYKNEKTWVDSHPMPVIMQDAAAPQMAIVPINSIEKYTHHYMEQIAGIYPDAVVEYMQNIQKMVDPMPRFTSLESAHSYVSKFVTKESLGIKVKGNDSSKDVRAFKTILKKKLTSIIGKDKDPSKNPSGGAGASSEGNKCTRPCYVCLYKLIEQGMTEKDAMKESSIMHWADNCLFKKVLTYSKLPEEFKKAHPIKGRGEKRKYDNSAKILATLIDEIDDEGDVRGRKKKKD